MLNLPEKTIHMNIKIDPEFRQLIPALQSEEYLQLEANLLADGCRDPLVLWNDILIDGHNRYEICTRHNIAYSTVQRDFEDRHEAKLWMLRNQLGRRNLPDPVRIKLAHEMKKTESEKAKERQVEAGKQYGKGQSLKGVQKSVHPNGNGRTQSKLADVANVSHFKYDQGEHIIENAPEWIQKLWIDETLSTNRAYSLTKLLRDVDESVSACAEFHRVVEPETIAILSRLHKNKSETFDEICASGYIQPGEDHQAIAITDTPLKVQKALDAKKKIHLDIARDIRWQEIAALPVEKYRVIYADPPWRLDYKVDSRAIENHYRTMDDESICALPVPDLCDDNAALFLWGINAKLDIAFQVIQAWGFTYRVNIAWVKDKIGNGWYVRNQHEILLIATRGDLPTPNAPNRPPSILYSPRLEHSQKPHKFYEIMENMYPITPRIELFARNKREGWDRWGNEA